MMWTHERENPAPWLLVPKLILESEIATSATKLSAAADRRKLSVSP
jgi:hypothetical protein